MNKSTLFAATAALMLAVPFAYAADVSASTKTEYKRDEDGSYKSEQTSKRETANGTAIKETSEVKVDKDDDGEYSKTVTNKTVHDPKGLMNKTTTKVTDKVESDEDGVKHKFKKVVNGDTVEEKETDTSEE